jgi:hypothetical protein
MRADRDEKRDFQLLERRKVLLKDFRVHEFTYFVRKKQGRAIQENDGQRIISGTEPKRDAKSLNRTVRFKGIPMDYHKNARRHEFPVESGLVKGDEAVTPIEHVRQDHEAAQRDPLIQPVSRNTVSLTAIGTDKKLCSSGRELQEASITQVQHPLIDQIQVDVDIAIQSLLAESCDGRHTRVRGRGGKQHSKLLFLYRLLRGINHF